MTLLPLPPLQSQATRLSCFTAASSTCARFKWRVFRPRYKDIYLKTQLLVRYYFVSRHLVDDCDVVYQRSVFAIRHAKG